MKYFRKFEKEVDFHNSDLKYPSVSFTVDSDKLWYYDEDFIIMTSESNPEVMAICYNQGWAANQDYMYRSEAAAVDDIGTAFNNGYFHSYTYNNFIYSFDEFKYFTSVTTIQQNAFNNQYELKSIKLPSSLLNIGGNAFIGCEKLNEIILPENLSHIGYGAFTFNKNISSLNIPKNALIEDNIFGGNAYYPEETYYLDYITVNDEHSVYSDLNCNIIFNKNTKKLIMGCGNSIIPSSVKSIGSDSFSHCGSVTNIIFEEGSQCKTIEYQAFYACKHLKSITLPNTITTIGDIAFANCESLTSITIPESVTSISERAFYSCSSLTSITIPNSVTSIGNEAFRGCSSLSSITIPESVISISNNAFKGCSFASDSFINNSSLDAEANGYWGATIVN